MVGEKVVEGLQVKSEGVGVSSFADTADFVGTTFVFLFVKIGAVRGWGGLADVSACSTSLMKLSMA